MHQTHEVRRLRWATSVAGLYEGRHNSRRVLQLRRCPQRLLQKAAEPSNRRANFRGLERSDLQRSSSPPRQPRRKFQWMVRKRPWRPTPDQPSYNGRVSSLPERRHRGRASRPTIPGRKDSVRPSAKTSTAPCRTTADLRRRHSAATTGHHRSGHDTPHRAPAPAVEDGVDCGTSLQRPGDQ